MPTTRTHLALPKTQARAIGRALRHALVFLLLASTGSIASAEPGPAPDGYRDAWALYRLRYDTDASAAVDAVLARSPGGPWQARATFLKGVLQRRTGDAKDSVATLRGLLEPKTRFDEHVRLELVRSLLAAGMAEEGLTALEALRKRHSGFASSQVTLEVARLLTRLGRTTDAIDAWKRVLKLKDKGIPKDQATHELAVLYGKAGDAENATKRWRRLALRMPGSQYAAEALTHVPLASMTDKDRLTRAERLFKAREYLLAKEAYESLLPVDKYAAQASLMLGAIYSERLRQDYDKARDYFIAASKSKDKTVAGPAMYKLGLVYGKLGQHDKAVKTLRKYRKGYKSDKFWSEAGFEVGRQLMDWGKYRAASTELAKWLAADKTVTDRSMYQWFVGWALYRGGFYADAIKEFKRLAGSRNTLVGDKALYWIARAQDALGKRQDATKTLRRLLERFPFGYYSWLAKRRAALWELDLGVPEPDFSQLAAWPEEPWGTVPVKGARASAVMDRVRDLVEIGEVTWARAVWEDERDAVRSELGTAQMSALEDALDPVLERFKERRNSLPGSAGAVRTKYPEAATLESWRGLFPKAWEPLTRVVTKREGIPEVLLYSHMLQESRYSPYAVSNAPAYGVLQLLRRTARRICDGLTIGYDPHDLFEAGTNIRLGAWYLGALARRFHGQLPLAVASYNGGPKLLSFHMDTHKGLDMETLIEDLPTHQSRNYVRKVLEHYYRYLAIYASPAERDEQMKALIPDQVDTTYEQEPSY